MPGQTYGHSYGGHRSGGKSYSGGRNTSGGYRGSRTTGAKNWGGGNRSGGKRGGFVRKAIDVSRFIQKGTEAIREALPMITHSFADFNFSGMLSENLKSLGYLLPTPIQDQAIPLILGGRDIIGLANTGTGKTGAFLLPLIEKVWKKKSANKSERVLIIAPTRELAIQIEEEFRKFSRGMRLYSAVCVGGMSIRAQMDALKRNPNFVIGTPGRLMDMRERKAVLFSSFKNVVLDEVDRMLDMGFIDPIKKILKEVPTERQSLFFSATIPPKIKELAGQFLKDPVTVKVISGQTAANVEQNVIRVRDIAHKFEELQKLLSLPEFEKVLIFSETKREVERLVGDLLRKGFKTDAIHGNKRQSQRQKALSSFRDSRIRILVATDVAARGLDIKNVTHVINYTIPQTNDDYIHRIGRTGRGESKGKAITFV